jgi:hypothetical protein
MRAKSCGLPALVAFCACVSGCASYEAENVEAFVSESLQQYLRYESDDKRLSLRYVGNGDLRTMGAAPESYGTKRFGGMVVKTGPDDKGRILSFGKRKGYYMAETSVFTDSYGGAYLSFGLQKKNGLSPMIGLHVDF